MVATDSATQKQLGFIFSLAAKVQGKPVRFLSEVAKIDGLGFRYGMSQQRRGLTKGEASNLIERLNSMLG